MANFKHGEDEVTKGQELYRLVYVSHGVDTGDLDRLDAEVADILAASRRNNQAAGITGALLFSSGCFAQTLEGTMDAVTATFERIQCDTRHRDTLVLQAGPVASREFGDWSMAYAGRVADARLRFERLMPGTSDRLQTATDLLDVMRRVVLRAEAA